MRNQVFKKLFSVLLALIMVAGLLPASAMAGGWGAMDVDTTPVPTETVQPTESAEPTKPAETETPEVTEAPEPTPENPATTVESDTDPTPAEEVILAPVNEVAVQAETKINYVTKTNSVPLPDGTFYRIVHLDCGRKYFKVDEIKKIIDFAAANSYTHVELAFGNDGLRFLLGDMSVTVGGTTYENDKVKAAIQQGNIAYSHAGELTEEEMGNIIAYAQGKGIGIIPMFDAPGHLQAVVKAMETLEVQVEYTTPTQSGSSWNYAVNTTDVVSVNFIQALMQKYITYFAGKGCTMFNIAADECGFTQMSGDTYTAYAKLVNSMAAMVQNAGMTALAFNDGIYHKNLTTNVEFDTDIAICYWDASESTYASAATLAGKGFKIINTHNKWYYVPGNDDSKWFGYEWSKGYMNGEAKDCTKTDGGYSGDNVSGCMNAIWLDNPNVSLTDGIWKKIEDHIALLAKNNPTHFKAEEVKVPAVEITEGKTVKEVRKSEQGEGTYEVVLFKESTTAQTLKLTVANGAEGAQYSWTSNNDAVATVEDGIVTFKGAAGTVTITATPVPATPVAATRSINETAAYSITFNVTKEDVTNAPKLPVQLWITNYAIEADYKTSENYWAPTNWTSKNNNAFYVNIEANTDGVNSDVGKSINELMPEGAKIDVTDKPIGAYEYGGTYYKTNTYDTSKVAKQLVVWSGRVHNYTEGNIQKLYGKDYSNAGTEFEYIRYYNNQWAVSNDRVTWTPVKGTNSITDEQIVVYYMIRSEITAEITTDVADWGSQQGEAAYTTQVSSNNQGKFVLLDFRVKYYDGVVRPENFAVANKTFAFHCTPNDSGGAVHQKNGYNYRDLNNFRAVNTSNYEVYMVTVTMTSDDPSNMLNATQANNVNGGYTYNGEEQVLWAIDDETFAKSGLDKYTSISGSSVYSVNVFGDEPYIRGVEVYSKHGALITYYVREKEAPDFLTVNYYVQGETTPFYTYTISVKPNTVFSQDFRRVSETQLTGNTVENVIGVTQTVQWDLKLMPQIGAQYRYTDYKFVDANREGTGKTVNLYYTFNATKTFVVDFGLPLRIEPKDLNENLADNGVNITETKLTGVSNFAYVSADTNGVITYKLKEMISQSDTFGVQYTGTLTTNTGLQDGTTAKYTVTIIPATNVYYEDSFAKFYGSDGTQQTVFNPTSAGDVAGTWYVAKDTSADNNANANQALEALGQENHNPYGYDPAYDSCTMFSMGSARKVTVTSDMAKDGVVWPTAQFTFKGTGFDIISLTDNTSGAIFVDVYKGKEATGNRFKSYMVDNYYGYKYENGAWVVDKNASNALYQIPVMRMRDLGGYGEYTAVVTVFYDRAFDHADRKSYNFWLDAVRVYDPMGESVNTGNTYGQDGEAYPQYIKLRSELKELNSDGTASSGALFIDGKGNANISEYSNYGPNNEVYLANGQAITFMLTGNDLSKIATVQIGAKSPNSNGTKNANMVIGNITQNLNTATEMYYDITTAAVKNGNAELVTITNTGEAILSLTNLKITYTDGNQTVSLGEVRAEQQTQAVQVVRALFAPAPVEPEPEPEPEKTFEPERFEASWSRNVMQGRKATLTVKTSEDVEAITVDGQTIRSYRTRTERVGFGRRAKRITYREFTYSMVAQESADFSVTAINAEGTESEAITARLTVKTRPNSMRDMWDWFKGWF